MKKYNQCKKNFKESLNCKTRTKNQNKKLENTKNKPKDNLNQSMTMHLMN